MKKPTRKPPHVVKKRPALKPVAPVAPEPKPEPEPKAEKHEGPDEQRAPSWRDNVSEAMAPAPAVPLYMGGRFFRRDGWGFGQPPVYLDLRTGRVVDPEVQRPSHAHDPSRHLRTPVQRGD